jgi:two-component system KDP operon response regulator KdpE
MKQIWLFLRSILQVDFAWGGMLFVAGSLTALLVVPTWQNNTLARLREQNVNISQFVEDINDLEVTIQDMRLASRGYIITQNVLFHQQYTDASARQQKIVTKLIQDATLLNDSLTVNELVVLKQAIDDWRVQRLDHQVALVENNNVAAAEADFVQGTKIRAFDAIRTRIDSLRITVRATQNVLQEETQRVHAINLSTNTVLAVVALVALTLVVIGVWRQAQLLTALQHAKNESQQLMLALSDRIDEVHQQHTLLATAQDIVQQSMRFGDDVYKADQIVQIIQQTLNLPVVVVWFDDIYTNDIMVRSAIRAPITLADIEKSIDAHTITQIRAAGGSIDSRRIRVANRDLMLYPLGNAERSVGVLGVMSEDVKPLDALTLLQITLLIDNYRLFTALQREQNRLRILFDVVPLGFVLIDVRGGVLVANQHAQQLLPGLAVGSSIHTVFTQLPWWGIGGNTVTAQELPLSVAIARGVTSSTEVMHEINDERIPVRHQVVAIRDTATTHGFVLVLEDMRHRYELDRLKADFVSMISHELRTPLATIVGATTMLLNTTPTVPRDGQQSMLQLLQNQGQRLQTLIEDVLNLSRIDSDGIRLQRERIDVLPLVQRILAKYAHTRRRLHVVTHGTLAAVYGDISRMEQIFHNILDNAEKYAPPGDVEITIQQTAGTPSLIQFAIRDYGTPLNTNEYLRVFDRFYQANQRPNKGGVGLGLTICKYFVEAHGGEIAMHAAPNGEGTVVTFTIPTVEAEPAVVESSRAPRVLLLEDEPAVQRVMQHILQSHSIEVTVVNTIFQAQEKIERSHFDVLIVDIMLPDGSGLDFVRDVRLWLTIPILVVTARGSEADVVAGLRAGVDDYMVKPFSNDEFTLRVQALFRRGQLRQQAVNEPVVTIGNVQVVIADKQIQVNGVALDLTPIEYRLLMYFVRHAGQVLSHEQILQGVWGERYEQENQYLWVHISHLRRKMAQLELQQLYIENVRGIGYRLVYREPRIAVNSSSA